MLIDAFTKAARQMLDGRMLGILVLALVITVVLTGPFLLVLWLIATLIEWVAPEFAAGLQSGTTWVFWTYVMAPLILAIVGTLLDRIVDAVEARHYPRLPKVRARSTGNLIFYAVRFLGLILLVNLGAYLVSWLTGVPSTLLFVLATGYLIAREYYDTVALRRLDEAAAKRSARANILVLWAAGCVIGIALNIPFANLFVPILGVAAFTHLFHEFNT